MTTIEKMKTARQRVLNGAASLNTYDSWWEDVGFARRELAQSMTNSKGLGFQEIPQITIEELRNLDKKTLYDFGFGNWDDNLILIPLWIVGFMDKNEIVTCINGNKETLATCDKDIRFGCIAWGFEKQCDQHA